MRPVKPTMRAAAVAAFLVAAWGAGCGAPGRPGATAAGGAGSVGSGGSGQTTDDGFTGKMDEVRIWKVARNAQQIADNYKLILTGAEPGLVAYYHFDDGAGTAPKDSSSAHDDAAFNSDGGRPVPTWVDSTDLVLTCNP